MTKREVIKLAKTGIETTIEKKCKYIADTWASPANIASLKELLAQYDEITQRYDAACREESTPR